VQQQKEITMPFTTEQLCTQCGVVDPEGMEIQDHDGENYCEDCYPSGSNCDAYDGIEGELRVKLRTVAMELGSLKFQQRTSTVTPEEQNHMAELKATADRFQQDINNLMMFIDEGDAAFEYMT
jgi:hypothetical protein